jgi:hypothetical protein
MQYSNEEVVIINMLKQAVESKGCRLTEVDFETRTLKFDGPDEVVAICARAVADIIE